MNINADFSERATAHVADLAWQPSPMPGVERKMLDRIGDEVARATTIVRYAPGSHFAPHIHTGGEEFIVLEGVFQDEHGDYPAGSYIRNPPTSGHTPRSDEGCTIFVKLWQFDMQDRHEVKLNMEREPQKADPKRNGVTSALLHADDREQVVFEEWSANANGTVSTKNGAEILVIAGSIQENGETFETHDWLRAPDGYDLNITAGLDGAKLWIKIGNLNNVTIPKLK